ncbi:polysaccharide deacetylase family protein [bacterium]|nr:polysaccharide deacetylase family protein [bacterium]
MRFCGPLLLALLLFGLPAQAQVERSSSNLTSRSRTPGSVHRGGWINPDTAEEEAAPVWNYRQEQAVRRVFRGITADAQSALQSGMLLQAASQQASQRLEARSTAPAQSKPREDAALKLSDRPLSFPEYEAGESTEDSPAMTAPAADAGAKAEAETDTDSLDPASAEMELDSVDAAAEDPPSTAATEKVEEQDPVNESAAEEPQRPAAHDFRVRRNPDSGRELPGDLQFPDEEAEQAAAAADQAAADESAPAFPDGNSPAPDDTQRIAESFIPDDSTPQPARLRPVDSPPSQVAKALAPLELPESPQRLSDYSIRSDISKITRGNSRLKQVALTFDDGPHPEYTGQILTILEYYNCPATFFFVGVQTNRYPQWVQMAHQQGHEIASQTYDHFRLPKLPTAEKEYQIDAYQDLIENLTGERPRFLRPPGGQIDDASIELLKKRGMVCAMWDVALNDTHGDKSRDELLDSTLRNVRNGSVILAHDGVQATIDMLPELIERLREEGYELVTMSELASRL